MFYPLLGKRILDVTVTVATAPIVVPVVAAAFIGHKLFTNMPFLFKQQRVGVGGKPFTIYKVQTIDADGGTTRFTRALRKSSVDELPQLWNVLKGDMTLVAPRPEMVCKAEANGIVDHVRHDIRPGLTGPFQCSALRDGEIVDGLHLDEAYVKSVSFRNDLAILAKTPVAVLSSRTN